MNTVVRRRHRERGRILMKKIVYLGVFWVSCAIAQPSAENAEAVDAATAPSEAPAQTSSESAAVSADSAYKVKVNELQGRVNELKEKIFRTKTRLAILKESVLSATIAGAEARLVHSNQMGSSFSLEKVIYSLDGTPIYSKVDAGGDLNGNQELEIFDGPIVPGNHTISVVMVYRGNGFGIFSYLRGYVFTLRSSHTFTAEEGKQVKVKVTGYEKGGLITDLKDRPDIRFENVISGSQQSSADKANKE